MESKLDKVLELFFNTPKHWHFEELRRKASISKPQLAQWLKILEKQKYLEKIKRNIESSAFRNRKKLFAKQRLQQSGLLDHLASLEQATVIIIFGSFSRWDWYDDSDIDIFIYGNDDNFQRGKYESIIKREIQVHNAQSSQDLQKIDKLLPYIISGDFIKGSIQDLGVEVHAKV